jgi:hypothetical protein
MRSLLLLGRLPDLVAPLRAAAEQMLEPLTQTHPVRLPVAEQ